MTTMMTMPPRNAQHVTGCDHHSQAEVTYVVLSLFSVPGGPHSATATVATPGHGYVPLTGLVTDEDRPSGDVLVELLDKTVAKIGSLIAAGQREHTGKWVIVTDSVHLMWGWEEESVSAVNRIDALLDQLPQLDYIELEVSPDLDCPCLHHGRVHAYRMSPVRAMTKEERKTMGGSGSKNQKQQSHRAHHTTKKHKG